MGVKGLGECKLVKLPSNFFILVKIGREGRVRKDGAISDVCHLNPFSYWPPLQKYNFLPILSLLCKSKMPVICFGKKYYASDCQKYAYTTSSPPLQEAGVHVDMSIIISPLSPGFVRYGSDVGWVCNTQKRGLTRLEKKGGLS